MNQLSLKFQELKARGEKGLIGFIMAGQPDFETGVDCAVALEEAGCDVLEIGVPYADPLADGEIIERAHFRGIEQGMNMSRALEFTAAVRERCQVPLVVFSYFNPILKRGLPAFAKQAEAAGASAVIIPDLPLEERVGYETGELDIIPMVAPTADAERIALADSLARSFIYCVSIAGVTGLRERLPDVTEYLGRVRADTTHPLALGFGISLPEQVVELKEHVDALVVGSILVKTIEEYAGEKGLLLRELHRLVSGLKQAAK